MSDHELTDLVIRLSLLASLAANFGTVWRARRVDIRLDTIEKFLRIAKRPP